MVRRDFATWLCTSLAVVFSFGCADEKSVGDALASEDVSLSLAQPLNVTRGVPNGSLEQASDLDPNMPEAWYADRWGNNEVTFTYATTGHTGRRSVLLEVTSHVSGDAKWYFAEQPVIPGRRYFFSDYYLCDAESFLVARFTMADGQFTYARFGTAPPSPRFVPAKGAFEAPAGAVSVTVFHGLATRGSLQLDDAALALLPRTPTLFMVPNGRLESEAFPGARTPASWHANTWGELDASFSYAAGGHSGARSVRVEISAYTDGRASWYFEPQALAPGRAYRFSSYYKANVDTGVLATVTLTDGSTEYVQLPIAFASPTWRRYSTEFWAPKDAAKVTIHQQLSQVGYLQTDDYALYPTQVAHFDRGLASLTFDDGWLTDYSQALPVLEAQSAVATHYVITGLVGQRARMTWTMLATLAAQGHEIAAHTVHHYDLTTLSKAAMTSELVDSKKALRAVGFGPELNLATPYGAYSEAVIDASTAAYRSHRTTEVGYNTKSGFDRDRLRVQNIRATTTLDEVRSWAAQAVRDRSWLILVYHDIADPPTTMYGTTPSALRAHVAALVRSGLPIVTVQQALDELTPQLR